MFGNSIAGLATESHELHRIRRGVLENFFSKMSVRKLEPAVQSVVDKLVARLQDAKGTGRVINVDHMFSAFTTDVVTQYSFARPYGYLDEPDFAPHLHQGILEVSQMSHFLKQFGWVEPVMKSMPIWMVKIVSPQMMGFISLQEVPSLFYWVISCTDRNLAHPQRFD